MPRPVGALLATVGAFMLSASLFGNRFSLLSIWTLIGLILLYVGIQTLRGKSITENPFGLPSAKSQNYPPGFNATYAHKNIAIDTSAGTVWLKDRGTAVISKRDIIGVEAQSDSSNHQTNIGPRTIRLNCRLIVRTRDIGKPVWTIDFDAHFSRSVSGGRANYEELQAWEGRMLAFLAAVA